MKHKHDLGTYAALLTPLSKDAANENIEAFFDEIGKLRQKYHIADVLVVIKACVDYDGAVGQAAALCQYGNECEGETLAAYALGRLQAESRQRINQLVARRGVSK